MALEHAAGVRDADHVSGSARRHRAAAADLLVARILFEDIPDDLHGRDVAAADGFDALAEPTDRGAERDAVHANLAFLFERFEQLP